LSFAYLPAWCWPKWPTPMTAVLNSRKMIDRFVLAFVPDG
jgi:hypothetical protein